MFNPGLTSNILVLTGLNREIPAQEDAQRLSFFLSCMSTFLSVPLVEAGAALEILNLS